MCANVFAWSGCILRICSLLQKKGEPNLRVRIPFTGRHGKDTTVSGAQRILQIESSTLFRQRDNRNVPQEFQTTLDVNSTLQTDYRMLHHPAFVAGVSRCQQMSSSCRHIVLLSVNEHSPAAHFDGRNV